MEKVTFGSFLRERRKAKGCTLKQLAGAASVSYSLISRWETGIRKPEGDRREALLSIGDYLEMDDGEKNLLLHLAGLYPLTREEVDIDKILNGFDERWRKSYFLHRVMRWDNDRIGRELGIAFFDVEADLRVGQTLGDEAALLQRHRPPESSLVIVLRQDGWTAADLTKKKGGKVVAFTLGNISDNVLIVDKICLEVLKCESFDVAPPIEAMMIPFEYEIELKPDYIGEYVVTQQRFKYAGCDADDFEVVCLSPPGFIYTSRLKIYCNDLATKKAFTLCADPFHIKFYKRGGRWPLQKRRKLHSPNAPSGQQGDAHY
jgi:transcriptional regulator with XRE-family HTH domain